MPDQFAPFSERCYVFETDLGWMAFCQEPSGISQLTIGHASPKEAWESVSPLTAFSGDVLGRGSPLIERLRRYAAGSQDNFSDVRIAFEGRTEFQRRVLDRCRRIPFGQTMSYAELADAVGSPGAARAIGQTMSINRVSIIVPCHRVVASGGKLGGYSAGDGRRLKARLLALEDVAMRRGQPKGLAAQHS